jgi:hypothetical protein
LTHYVALESGFLRFFPDLVAYVKIAQFDSLPSSPPSTESRG